jgi:hypothetical protein
MVKKNFHSALIFTVRELDYEKSRFGCESILYRTVMKPYLVMNPDLVLYLVPNHDPAPNLDLVMNLDRVSYLVTNLDESESHLGSRFESSSRHGSEKK